MCYFALKQKQSDNLELICKRHLNLLSLCKISLWFSDIICKISHVFFFHLTVLEVQNYVFHYFPFFSETLDSSKFRGKGGGSFMCPLELTYFSPRRPSFHLICIFQIMQILLLIFVAYLKIVMTHGNNWCETDCQTELPDSFKSSRFR